MHQVPDLAALARTMRAFGEQALAIGDVLDAAARARSAGRDRAPGDEQAYRPADGGDDGKCVWCRGLWVPIRGWSQREAFQMAIRLGDGADAERLRAGLNVE